MSLFQKIAGGLRALLRKQRVEQDMEDELRAYVDASAAHKQGAGLNPQAAVRAARLEAGSIDYAKEKVRATGWESTVESFWQDVRFGLRTLRKNPSFTVVAVLTLALGIGANTAVFSVVSKVLLQPLPYPEPDRLVMLMRDYPTGPQPVTSVPKFMVWREQTQVFQAVAAYDWPGGSGVSLTGSDRPEPLKGIHVSREYFDVFGAQVTMGRAFDSDEDRPGGPHVVLLSNGLWRNHFGSDPGIVGKAIALGGDPYEVIGVLDSSFAPDPSVDVWLPLQMDPSSTDQANYLAAAARLRPGVTIDQAQAAMKVAAEEFHRKFPGSLLNPQESATVEPLRNTVVADVRPALLILLGAVSFVLLIACANVANLLLARGALRKREITIRRALGASRGRVVRQLLTESMLLSLAGGAIGLIAGVAGIRALLSLYANDPSFGNTLNIPRIGEHGSGVTADWRVLAFTTGISIVTGVFAGSAPAWNGSRTNLNGALKETGARSGTSFRQGKTRWLLSICEVALAVILLTGAILLIRTFAALRMVNPGFDARNVLTMQTSLSGTRFDKTARVAEMVREAEQRVGALSGIEELAAGPPPVGAGPDLPFSIEGRPPTSGPYSGDEEWRDVSPGFFSVFRIPLLRGRTFTDRDDSSSDGIVVINEAMVKKYWPNNDPLGTSITIGHGLGVEFEEPPRRIVGVVGNIRDRAFHDDPRPMMYIPIAQQTDGITTLFAQLVPFTWEIRTKVEPFSLSANVQSQILVSSGGLPAANVRSMDQIVASSTTRNDFTTVLLSSFAIVALFLAAIGIYGVMSYSVEQRTHEIGIRVALGARLGDVRNMVVREALLLVLIGLSIGVSAAWALSRVMAGLLYGVTPRDPFSFGAVVVLLGIMGLVAAYIPARRATKVDPMFALRYE